MKRYQLLMMYVALSHYYLSIISRSYENRKTFTIIDDVLWSKFSLI